MPARDFRRASTPALDGLTHSRMYPGALPLGARALLALEPQSGMRRCLFPLSTPRWHLQIRPFAKINVVELCRACGKQGGRTPSPSQIIKPREGLYHFRAMTRAMPLAAVALQGPLFRRRGSCGSRSQRCRNPAYCVCVRARFFAPCSRCPDGFPK